MLLSKVATEIFKIIYVVHITFLLGSTALNYWLKDLLVDWCRNTQHISRKGVEWTVLAEACLIEAVTLELGILFLLFKVFSVSGIFKISFMEFEISNYLQKKCVLKNTLWASVNISRHKVFCSASFYSEHRIFHYLYVSNWFTLCYLENILDYILWHLIPSDVSVIYTF